MVVLYKFFRKRFPKPLPAMLLPLSAGMKKPRPRGFGRGFSVAEARLGQ
jgi:hypothetical protein